ncbi:PqqD family protein [Streptomyces sp. AV19]|uniref:PqqD family protein n=1 Tax=Streptomyces sp. AV19 TaxID=2793068 RepID=UPI0018FEA711|nr:PqqD family protein [Streptomyces sp. AV19]MBH1938978.1 PqqD family protein [Streptomyces sp. AV19]MDG4536837.1 PqqD family protein [Streptomyces sp. AV19]
MLSVPGHVHWAHLEDGTAVLDLHTGQWHLFTGAGARIWDAITQHGDVEGLSEQLAIPAGHDPATDRDADRDAVATYVRRLQTMGLLTPADPPARTRRWWRR